MRRLAACVLVTALSGCGISAQDQPRALTSGAPTPQATTSTATTAVEQTTIYLVFDAKLKERTRDTVPKPSPQQVLDALQAEPSEQESRSGLTTGVTGTSVVDPPFPANGGVVTVQVPDKFLTPDNLAFGQIVLSLVRVSGVTGVQFVRDGKPIDVPDGEGQAVKGALKRANYSALVEASG